MLLAFHRLDIAWWEDRCEGDKAFIRDGWIHLSEKPSIEVELNDDLVKSLLWQSDRYFD